jgi:hypothetical protein
MKIGVKEYAWGVARSIVTTTNSIKVGSVRTAD